VVSAASPLFTTLEESRILGETAARAITRSDERVALLASGSLSRGLWPN
jgi:3,4-dihydroxyphenylacetate 2,3-dioxygenase